MKPNNWEGGNDKMVQVVKDIEKYLQRNLALFNTNKPPRMYGSFLVRSSTIGPTNNNINPIYKDLEQWMMLKGGNNDDEEGEGSESERGRDRSDSGRGRDKEREEEYYDRVDNEDELDDTS